MLVQDGVISSIPPRRITYVVWVTGSLQFHKYVKRLHIICTYSLPYSFMREVTRKRYVYPLVFRWCVILLLVAQLLLAIVVDRNLRIEQYTVTTWLLQNWARCRVWSHYHKRGGPSQTHICFPMMRGELQWVYLFFWDLGDFLLRFRWPLHHTTFKFDIH